MSTVGLGHGAMSAEKCTCCNKQLNPSRTVWLELDQRADTYHDFRDVPADKSQGWFPFGRACSKKVKADARRSNANAATPDGGPSFNDEPIAMR